VTAREFVVVLATGIVWALLLFAFISATLIVGAALS
jgi:hypothetical protein